MISNSISRRARDYDTSLEILLRLARLARHGEDVGGLLIGLVENNIEALASTTEFAVAMDVLPSPSDPRGL
jgi:hypothetical protein